QSVGERVVLRHSAAGAVGFVAVAKPPRTGRSPAGGGFVNGAGLYAGTGIASGWPRAGRTSLGSGRQVAAGPARVTGQIFQLRLSDSGGKQRLVHFFLTQALPPFLVRVRVDLQLLQVALFLFQVAWSLVRVWVDLFLVRVQVTFQLVLVP